MPPRKPAVARPGPDMLLEAACPAPVCGVDEAGRGPLAGPVCAAAVVLDPRRLPEGLNDSKKLTAKARERLELEIKASAISWSVAFASVEEIGVLNILHASGLAMRRAVEALSPAPALALVDGDYAFDLTVPVKTVIGGDGVSCSIAAASILAKTARDRVMIEMDKLHPGYGFADHKGYGVPVHMRALERLGPCAIHRMGWAPLRVLKEGGSLTAVGGLAEADEQRDL
jgi:ribonuclease HII